MSNQNDDILRRTLSLKRTFKADIKLVWEAWTEAEHIAAWWGPPGMNTEVIEHDFRVGGKWQYVMTMPDDNKFYSDGEYTDIVALTRIVSSANFKPMTEGIIIKAEFEAAGDQTNFKFSVIHPTEDYCKAQEKMGFMNGWGSVFDRLKSFLEK